MLLRTWVLEGDSLGSDPPCHLTSGSSFYLSVPQLPSLQNGNDASICLRHWKEFIKYL